ncbi:hypothetical protein [Paenibacillus sp. yr247]|nr:hypothetical protein [Paenibacillus sp. yr247]
MAGILEVMPRYMNTLFQDALGLLPYSFFNYVAAKQIEVDAAESTA